MKQIFISYRRKSWPFTHRLADDLRMRLDADIFVDVDSVDQTDFERAIMAHLRTSHVVALIVSEHTFADRIHRDDDWVRKELAEALRLNIPIVMVSVDGQLPPSALPDDIKDIARSQAINFYPDYFVPACERLASFLAKVADIPIKHTRSASNPPNATSVPVQPTPQTTLAQAIDLLNSDEIENLEKAVFLLEEVQKSGLKTRIDILAILSKARADLDLAKHQQEAAEILDEIRLLASSKRTIDQARALLQQFTANYPDILVDQSLLDILPSPRSNTPDSSPIASDKQLPNSSSTGLSPAGTSLAEPDNLLSGGETPRIEVITPPPPRILKLGDTRTDPKGIPQVYVPAGRFLMGSDPKRDKHAEKDEQPQHEVHITQGFWLDQFPVTNAYFQAFVDDGGYREDRWWSPAGLKWRGDNNITSPKDYKNFTKNPKQPRVGINWYESEAYANWRDGRLPTEAEWEYAARGEKSLIYPWGDDYDPQRLNSKQRISKTTPVDAYPNGKSWCGAFDMSGNVWEWCADCYAADFYEQCVKDKVTEDPFNIKTPMLRVLRGGAWGLSPLSLYCRAAFRDHNLVGRSYAVACRVVAAAVAVS